ncbi:MAG: condensation domain-containing protein, partial [Vicinamibacteria bacterium]
FDACAWEIWPHLASGASLHFPDEDTRMSPPRLWSWMQDEGITIAFLPTPLAEAAIAETIPETMPLRVLLTGGDRLKSGASPDFPFGFVNHYGLTETAVVATAGLVTEASSPSIGRPIARTRVYLLDSSFEPVPIGVKGEMFVGGVAVARGYLDDPEKTAERFVPDPFSTSPGARMFRAGDFGRYLPDGSIEFLGRNDDQIKIRGFRVELAEVERALLEHEAVMGAAVLCREDEPGRKRIVAYYTGEGESGGLSSFLAERLPPHMIPSAFVKLDSFPLTSNGKVDRKRLRAPEPPVLRLAPILPTGRTESILARNWSEVQRVEVLSIHDDYFELGGDSILSIQIVARARAEGLALTAKDVFQNPTIAALAALSARAEEVPEEDEEGEGVESDVPLTPIQRWFFEQNFPEPHHFNQAFLFRLRRPIGPDLLRRAVDCVLSHHHAFRLRYTDREGEWHQVRSPIDNTAAFTAIDLSGLRPSDRVAALTERAAEIQRSFSLEAGPLVRAALFDFGEQPGRFLMAAHHLVVDGVSFRILLSDLETVLDQMERFEEPKLPPKTSSFAAWARRLQAHAATEELSDELEHWVGLAPSEPTPLRRDRPRGENRVASLATVSVFSSEEEASRLLQQVPRAYQTRTHEVLLAALVAALATFSGERKLLLTLEGHGREALFDGVDVSRTVGWFTSLFPVLLDAMGARGAGDTLKAIKEQLRSIPARGLGYGLLRHLSPDESIRARLGSAIVPEVAFNYLGRFDSVLDAGSRFAFSAEPIGPTRSPLAMRLHLLEVMAVVVEGKLRIDFTFSDAIHRRQTIEDLASSYLEALRALIDHCLEPAAGGYTPSDFALAGLDQAQLDELLKEKG